MDCEIGIQTFHMSEKVECISFMEDKLKSLLNIGVPIR